MSDTTYNINLKKLCENLDLGSLINEPEPVYGGLLNKMFRIETSKGRFAVKAINPQIMLRNTAMKNYVFSEKVANIACESGINALPAITVDGSAVHEVDGQFYLAFPWFDGTILPPGVVDTDKCKIIGGLLAEIHGLDFSSITDDIENTLNLNQIDWNGFTKTAKAQNIEWLDLFSQNLPALAELEKTASESYRKLCGNMVISHRDLDQKNVLWDGSGVPMIIDWEAAGYINPSSELLEVALYWSGGESEVFVPSERAFKLIVKSYCEAGGCINDNLNDVLYSSLIGKLGWLEYSIKRSLRIECADDSEQLLGTKQVIGTINSIIRYEKFIPLLREWLSII